MELMPKASVRRDFLLHSLAITAILGVRLDSGWWNRSPDGWVQAGWVPFKSASFPLPAGTLAPEGSSARAGGDNVGFQLMRRCWLWWADRRQRTRLQPMCPLCTIAIPIALSPLLHTGDHSPVASSSPHPVVELLCRVGGACVDSREHRLWQFQACNLFFNFTFRSNESILLSKLPFSIWSMLDIIVIHEYRSHSACNIFQCTSN